MNEKEKKRALDAVLAEYDDLRDEIKRRIDQRTHMTQLMITIDGTLAGVAACMHEGFRYLSRYSTLMGAVYDGNVFLFLARADNMNMRLGEESEHDLFAWLPLQKAIDRVSFPNSRNALLKAHEFLILRKLSRW